MAEYTLFQTRKSPFESMGTHSVNVEKGPFYKSGIIVMGSGSKSRVWVSFPGFGYKKCRVLGGPFSTFTEWIDSNGLFRV